jgi:hypothetical protein
MFDGITLPATWEQNFERSFAQDELVKFNPDILIIRLGENVNEEYAKKTNYDSALLEMINKFKQGQTKVIITGNFWSSAYKDQVQSKVAADNGFVFVPLQDLESDVRNKAIGQFANAAVANHPSDFGMKNIAERIFFAIQKNKMIE